MYIYKINYPLSKNVVLPRMGKISLSEWVTINLLGNLKKIKINQGGCYIIV